MVVVILRNLQLPVDIFINVSANVRGYLTTLTSILDRVVGFFLTYTYTYTYGRSSFTLTRKIHEDLPIIPPFVPCQGDRILTFFTAERNRTLFATSAISI